MYYRCIFSKKLFTIPPNTIQFQQEDPQNIGSKPIITKAVAALNPNCFDPSPSHVRQLLAYSTTAAIRTAGFCFPLLDLSLCRLKLHIDHSVDN